MTEIEKLHSPANRDVCKHEWLADTASLFAVILLFGSVWAIMQFHDVTLDWMHSSSLLQTSAAYGLLLADAVLIVSLLCFGPSCHSDDKSCFSTFKGRRR
ncbi:MAG: hypothetical protein PVG66_04035 [Chromatiales bacterium]|jgi:hypothetical protein